MSIADNARKIPAVAKVEGAVTGALVEADDLPIADYDAHTAEAVAGRLRGLSQRELRMVDAYERKHQNRETIVDRIAKLSGEEPWSGYDEQDVAEIAKVLTAADAETARTVRAYERDHKERAGVIEAADRRI